MYRSFQPLQDFSQLARLTLAKFSFTTTSLGHNGPLNWSHVIGNGDLIGTFEKRSVAGSGFGRVILRISRELDILEDIDLTHFVREANANQSRQKPSFAVIVKLPCLAVKYPSGSTYLRRFQIKFSSDRDYYTALAILSDIKCPFSESSIGPAPSGRKLTSSSWNLGASARESPAVPNWPASNSAVFPFHSSAAAPGTIPSTAGPSPSFAPHTTTSLSGHLNSQSSGIPQHPDPSLQTGPGSSPDTLSRPSTATTCHDPQTLNQVLPPKRELPFSKPGAKKPRLALQEKQPNLDSTLNPAQPPSSKDTQLLPSPSITPSTVPGPKRDPSPQTHPNPNSRVCVLRLPPNPTSTPTPNTILAQNKSLPIIPTKHSQPQPQPQPQPQALDQALAQDQAQAQHTSDPIQAALTKYLSAPTRETTVVLEDWMARAIESDTFMRLCWDAEGDWRRVALGL